jgi:hypothetical protein
MRVVPNKLTMSSQFQGECKSSRSDLCVDELDITLALCWICSGVLNSARRCRITSCRRTDLGCEAKSRYVRSLIGVCWGRDAVWGILMYLHRGTMDVKIRGLIQTLLNLTSFMPFASTGQGYYTLPRTMPQGKVNSVETRRQSSRCRMRQVYF